MKKLLILVALAAVGCAVWKKITQDDEERDLWAEVTDKL